MHAPFLPRCTLSVLALTAGAGQLAAQQPPIEAASVYANANIYTVDPQRPRAEAIAIADGRIVAVGSNQEIQRYITSNTEVIDLHGTTRGRNRKAESGCSPFCYPPRVRGSIRRNPTGCTAKDKWWSLTEFSPSVNSRNESEIILIRTLRSFDSTHHMRIYTTQSNFASQIHLIGVRVH